MDALIEMPAKGLTQPAARKSNGLALINATLTDIPDVMATAKHCHRLYLDAPDDINYLGSERRLEEEFLDRAKIAHRYLCYVADADAAYTSMLGILEPGDRDAITQ